jgi:hypothetical protein
MCAGSSAREIWKGEMSNTWHLIRRLITVLVVAFVLCVTTKVVLLTINKSRASQISELIILYYRDHNRFPKDLSELAAVYTMDQIRSPLAFHRSWIYYCSEDGSNCSLAFEWGNHIWVYTIDSGSDKVTVERRESGF